MAKCIICKNELEGNEVDICKTCAEFFSWKYRRPNFDDLEFLKKFYKKTLGGKRK